MWSRKEWRGRPRWKVQGRRGKSLRRLKFSLFALRDLKTGEKIVLGWEWDEQFGVHVSAPLSILGKYSVISHSLPRNWTPHFSYLFPTYNPLTRWTWTRFDIHASPAWPARNPIPPAPNDEHSACPLFSIRSRQVRSSREGLPLRSWSSSSTRLNEFVCICTQQLQLEWDGWREEWRRTGQTLVRS